MGRVAIYTRVSTDDQTTNNQRRELERWAARARHKVVAVYEDKGISGAKGRDKRPQFDAVLKAAVRREFDVVAVWSSDRLGRSMPHLIEVLQTIRETGIGLYIHTQSLDTTTPAGRAMYQMLGVFSEFEREMIVARINAGMARAKAQGTKSGNAIGRPKGASYTKDGIKRALLSGQSVRQAAKRTGASVGAVAGVRKELVAAGAL